MLRMGDKKKFPRGPFHFGEMRMPRGSFLTVGRRRFPLTPFNWERIVGGREKMERRATRQLLFSTRRKAIKRLFH